MKNTLLTIYGLLLLLIGTSAAILIVRLALGSGQHGEEHSEKNIILEQDPQSLVDEWLRDPRHHESHFHQVIHRKHSDSATQSACLTCHSVYPHKKSPRYRGFLNQHSRFMTCLVCHLDSSLRHTDGFAWSAFGTTETEKQGGPYGLHYLDDARLSGNMDMTTRLVPLGTDGSVEFISYEDPDFVAYRDRRRRGTNSDSSSFRSQAEGRLGSIALLCRDCHGENGVIPWKNLGFSEDRRLELIHSAQVEMVETEDVFYFPALR